MKYRFGQMATYQGKDYDLLRVNLDEDKFVIRTMDPEDGFIKGRVGYIKTVKKNELEKAFYVFTYCIYLDHIARIDGQKSGFLELTRNVSGDGFLAVDRDEYSKKVSENDPGIGRIWEERKPILGFHFDEIKQIIREKD